MMPAPLPRLSPLGRAAVAYAQHGWAVFPLAVRGKVPLHKGGFHTATTDEAQIGAWWRAHPAANIGLAPGKSGLVVIDVDGPEGEATAARIGALAEPTLVCTTGRADGGRHCYFRRPDFAVSNCEVGPCVDVRGDAGYVILPPSIHPSGTPYRWVGRADEIAALPERTLAALQAAQTRETERATSSAAGPSDAAGGSWARDVALGEVIGEGGRNAALTRYAGRLLARGIPEGETLALVWALNATKCKPPLPVREVTALVASIAGAEQRKRAAAAPLALVRDNVAAAPEPAALPKPDIPAPADVAAEQVEAARGLLARDLASAPRWGWPDLGKLAGPMLPGDFVVVGSLMGNGKSTLLMSQMDAFASAKMPTLYLPLEVDPSVVRVRWAAWKLGYDARAVLQQDWAALPEGARDCIDAMLDEQATGGMLHFATPKRVTLPALAGWCRWAKEHAGARVVMLDHLHRMDFGADGPGYRVTVTEAVRRLKDLARELELVLVAAAQLNRSPDPIDAYTPPTLGRLKESAGIGEEADVVLMLSRALRRDLPDKWGSKLRLGQLSERDLCEPGVMVVTCRKHRLDDAALNASARLAVERGRVVSAAPTWRLDAAPAHIARDWSPPWDRDSNEDTGA